MVPMIALFAAGTLACYEVVEPPLVLTLQLPDTGTGDGASLSLLTVAVDSTLPLDKRTVSLTTTAGNFTGSGTGTASVTLDDTRTATALLRAPADSTIAVVTATVDNATVTGRVTFRRAQPERLDVVPERFTLKAGIANEIAITVFEGKPSPSWVPVRWRP
jgi:hypothetical protein